MTPKPWCSICGRILEDVDSWSEDRPTEPGWYWVKTPGEYSWASDPHPIYIESIPPHFDAAYPEGTRFARVAPHPPLPKEEE